MRILLNEKEYAEKIIQDGQLGTDEFYSDLFILIKYLYSEGERKSGILKTLKLMSVDTDKFYELICKYISRASSRKLVEIDYVPITQNEIDKIREVKNKSKEKLLFTLLIMAKYNNLKSGRNQNNDWVNLEEKEIFKLARVSCNKRDRDKMIYELKEDGYIKNSKKITSLNMQVLFVDNESDPVLKITDMRELGFQYEELLPNNKVRRCINCGKPYKLKRGVKRVGLCPLCDELRYANGKLFKVKQCKICGAEFVCPSGDNRSYLCPEHQKEMTKQKKAAVMQKLRKNK